MNMFKFYFATILLVLQSCSNSGINALDEEMYDERDNNTSVSYVIPLDKALETAENVFSCIDNEELVSRAKASNNVKNIQIYSNSQHPLSRCATTEKDTVIYIVNYDKGFAILGADYRLAPIYAISLEGNINITDTIENKGLSLFFKNLDIEISSKTRATNSRATIPEVNGNINSPYQITDISLEYKKGPYGKHRLWGQASPYNYYCPQISGTKTLVGCVAVATGLIMAHHQHPNTIDGREINWSAIENGQNDQIELSSLLYNLGDPKYLDMDYGILSSGAQSTNVPKTLRLLGYSCGDLETYDMLKIVSHYSNSENPVYMRGNIGIDDYGRYTGGHAWIIDGAMDIWMKYVMPGKMMETHAVYFYCNWGWEGKANGWFKHFSFAPVNGPELVEHGDVITKVDYNFNRNLQMILDIKPQ